MHAGRMSSSSHFPRCVRALPSWLLRCARNILSFIDERWRYEAEAAGSVASIGATADRAELPTRSPEFLWHALARRRCEAEGWDECGQLRERPRSSVALRITH